MNWNKRFTAAFNKRLKTRKTFLCGFNSNLDYLKRVDEKLLKKLFGSLPPAEKRKALALSKKPWRLGSVKSRREAVAALLWSMRNGQGVHVVASPAVQAWLEKSCVKPGAVRLGGQAGIMANALARQGARVLTQMFSFSKKKTRFFDSRVKAVVPHANHLHTKSLAKTASTRKPKTNWVLEFDQGLSFEGVTAKASTRAIYSQGFKGVTGFQGFNKKNLLALGEITDFFLLGGLHFLESREATKRFCRQLGWLKQANSQLFVHWEYVPFSSPGLAKRVLPLLCKKIDGIGVDDAEVTQIVSLLGLRSKGPVQDALRVAKALRLKRVHVHAPGYHVIVEPGASKEKLVEASLYSSGVAARVLGFKKPQRIAPQIIARANKLAASVEGVVVVPAPVSPKPRFTVGLGDVVAASALAFETA